MPIVIMKLGQWRGNNSDECTVDDSVDIYILLRDTGRMIWSPFGNYSLILYSIIIHLLRSLVIAIQIKLLLLVVWYMNLHEIIYLICLLCMVVHADFIYALWINSTWNILRPFFGLAFLFASGLKLDFYIIFFCLVDLLKGSF